MKLAKPKIGPKICWKVTRHFQLLLTILFSLAVVFGQTSPMQARSLTSGDSGWIEICGGEDGSYFIQTGQENENDNPDHDCMDCSLCAATSSGENLIPVPRTDVFQLSGATGFSFPQQSSTIVDCPEKYWSTSRAPPIASPNNNSILRNPFLSIQLVRELFEVARASRVGAL